MYFLKFKTKKFLTKLLLTFLFASLSIEIGTINAWGWNKQTIDSSNSSPLTPFLEKTTQKLALDPSTNKKVNTQSLTYLNRKNLRNKVSSSFDFKLTTLGKDFFENLINDVIKKEVEFKDNYYVFYHGQKREFLLLQDLYAGLNQAINKKTLKDFVQLRLPDSDLKKFRTVLEFLKESIKNGEIKNSMFDELSHIRKFILAVNPSLFGNNYNWGESTFSYFINSSNASYIDISNLVQQTFEHFNLKHLYPKYQEEIVSISALLSAAEQQKTGLLQQIFIPKEKVNLIAYQCKPWGLLYHSNPENNPASIDLETYKNDTFSVFTSDKSVDEKQFRLLINQDMLSPDNGIKIFRYTNQTENTKKYNDRLKNLLAQISNDIQTAN